MPHKDIIKRKAFHKLWWSKLSKEVKRGYSLKHKYGISVEQYNLFLEQQEGKCALCGIHYTELSKRLSVDHNHNTKAIRGLLCVKCNTLIGYYEVIKSEVGRIEAYLQKEKQC